MPTQTTDLFLLEDLDDVRRTSELAGTVQAPPLFLPGPLNNRLWHLGFNRIEKLNEQLVTGREDIFFGWEFDAAAKKLPDDVINYYVRILSNSDALRGSFGWYRALDTTIAQDEQRKTRRLTMPILAIGGAASWGALPHFW